MERKRIEDLRDLMCGAADALTKALSDGDTQHLPGTWRDRSEESCWEHLKKHIQDQEKQKPEDNEDHPSHIVIEAVMWYIKYMANGQ